MKLDNPLYGIYTNTDRTEGRGSPKLICYAVSEDVANDIAGSTEFYKRYGVMGCNTCNIKLVDPPPVYESITDYYVNASLLETEAIRRRALAKLSAIERAALDLGD